VDGVTIKVDLAEPYACSPSTTPPAESAVPFLPRLPSLDGLRAVSIGLVLLSHFYLSLGLPTDTLAGSTLISLGFFGVKIFFVISGYLITSLLQHEEWSRGSIGLGHFYLRRSFRILPAAYAFMVIAMLTFGHSLTLTNRWMSLLFIENYSLHPQWLFGHLWSLGVEEQFYLLWPVLFVLAPRHRMSAMLAVILAVPWINVTIIHLHWPYWNAAFYSVADALACGCVVAMLRSSSRLLSITTSRWFWCVPCLLIVAIPLSILPGGLAFGLAKSLLIRPGINLGLALCVHAVVVAPPRILNLGGLQTIGVMSYSLYLWQQPITEHPFPLRSIPLDLALRICCLAACAAGSYYLVEQPFLRLRRRLFR
jgi:peptidoglycan/LPS O-acetylase OafA/YrhL